MAPMPPLVQAFASWMGAQDVSELADRCGEADFLQWLCQGTNVESATQHTLTPSLPQSLPLVLFAWSARCDVGWRPVTALTVIEKVHAYHCLQKWPGSISARSTDKGLQPGCLHYVSGHQRCVSMWIYLRYLFDTLSTPEDWVWSMAGAVPVVVSSLTELEATFSGLRTTVERLHCTTSFSPYTLLATVDARKMSLEDFRKEVSRVLPGAVDDESIFPWTKMEQQLVRPGPFPVPVAATHVRVRCRP